MRYHAFNIGGITNEWWNRIRTMGLITAGFRGERGDRGDIILHDIDLGDWVIGYVSGFGFVGAGIASGPETYRLLKASDLPKDWESNHLHQRKVQWRYYVKSIEQAVSAKDAREIGCSLPSQTKQCIHDTQAAKLLIDRLAARALTQPNFFPEEVNFGAEYSEGAVLKVVVDRYERSPEARNACVAKWGNKCVVCDFDFGAKYGEIGAGYIHVHHLNPISHFGGEHLVDPIKDLRPVCPNCHAMLHRKNPPMNIESLRLLLRPK
jgi:5-methylcytosine-specific restriction endonuclease McrA